MIDIKVTTCAPTWPWTRQLPKGGPDWGPFRFHVDSDIEKCDIWIVFESMAKQERVICAPERTVFITGEPDSIGRYPERFLKQFHHVVSGRQGIQHPRLLRMQQGQPWFVEKSYDELLNMAPIAKTKDLCVLTSAKAFTEGHRSRLAFVDALQQSLGDRVDVFGRGIKDFESKWEVLAPYRYTIVLENFSCADFITEKLPDAWLAFCVPFFMGCSNLDRYYSPGSWIDIDLANHERSIERIREVIDSPASYDSLLPAVLAAREHYLNQEQFFAVLANVTRHLLSLPASSCKEMTIRPSQDGPDIDASAPSRLSRYGEALLNRIRRQFNGS